MFNQQNRAVKSDTFIDFSHGKFENLFKNRIEKKHGEGRRVKKLLTLAHLRLQFLATALLDATGGFVH